MEAKKRGHPVYTEQYKSQAVEIVIHSGKSLVQIARELGCSEASLHGWKKAYLKRQEPVQIDGEHQSPEQDPQRLSICGGSKPPNSTKSSGWPHLSPAESFCRDCSR